MKRCFLLLLTFYAFESYAQIFTLRVTDYGGLDNFDRLKKVIDQEVKDLQDTVNDKIPDGSTNRIMKGMANTSVVAGKSGADYSSHMEKYMVSLGTGGAVDRGDLNGIESDLSGVGIAPSAVVGVNLYNMGVKKFGGLDGKRVNTYLTFMNFGYGTSLDSFLGLDSELKMKSQTIGFRMNYQWKEMQEHRHFTWGGIKLGWGIHYNESQFNFQHSLDETFQISDGDQNIQGRVTGQPKYRINVFTTSIPLEISSDITFFKFLTFYGGGGVDFNYGQAKGKALADGNVSPQVCTDSGAICGPGTIMQLQFQAGVKDSAWVEPVTGRVFFGSQINMPYFQLYAEAHKPVTNDILGFGVGVRFVR